MQNNLNDAPTDVNSPQNLSKVIRVSWIREACFVDEFGLNVINKLSSFIRRLRECPPVIVLVTRIFYRPVKTYLSQLRLVDKRLKPLLVKQAKHLKRQLKSDCFRQTLFFSSENSDSSSRTSEPAKA